MYCKHAEKCIHYEATKPPPIQFTEFLGKPIDYWIELRMQADRIDCSNLVSELAQLRKRCAKAERLIAMTKAAQQWLDSVK